MEYNPGLDIKVDEENMLFLYGEETFGPEVEKRYLDDIRKSLRDPKTFGPEVPYAIAMDIGKKKDLIDLKDRSLLYGAVIYSKGKLGEEPVRSQGHVHAVSASCGSSTPEVYEIWKGEAIIFMQDTAKDDLRKCFAVYAEAGEVVVVPPKWAHYTVNANPHEAMVFGAWCIRDYGFEYDDVLAHGGLAYFPVLEENNKISWKKNETYNPPSIVIRNARVYSEFGLEKGVPIYTQYEKNKNLFNFVTKPETVKNIWLKFEP
ncbi:glucose-6-phosphate isomerase family protein [Marinilactibacillus psychrotolerans]|uniref:glucose-6-phosphate isomerase n=1 Tax=Marinilactibacillus psychrotolerans TaxID=191770 RepID=A0A5R9C866_9LACT|nr:glucose-6-phosphate isomerase family protein [Marinilactibacillus psychrotolerans]TLQ09446.1 glucose-6-phosphate isomerase [Marinilactibacillus psychrotolerans]